MRVSVLDASALLRFYLADGPIPAKLERAFAESEQGDHLLLAPDLLWPEVGHVLAKRVLTDVLTEDEARELMDELLSLPIDTCDTRGLMQDALALAVGRRLTVYDALYLALARLRGATLLTCDHELAAAAGDEVAEPGPDGADPA